MKKVNLTSVFMISVMIFGITSCGILQQAIEPADEKQKTFDIKDFDRLEIGNAFHINVVQGATFKIKAAGDSRDIDDLLVEERNGTLEVSFRNKWRLRRYRMDIDIEMPALKEVDFSGATVSSIKGFNNPSDVKLTCQGHQKVFFSATQKRMTLIYLGHQHSKLRENLKKSMPNYRERQRSMLLVPIQKRLR